MNELLWVSYSFGFLVVTVVMLLLTKKVFDLATPYSVNVQLTGKDNPAVGVLMAGFLLGVAVVMCGVLIGDSPEVPTLESFIAEIVSVVIYGATGIALLFLAGIINDRIVLRKFSNRKEIIDSRNTAVAVVMASTYIASALVIAGGMRGSVDLPSLLISFGVGQLGLVLFACVYQLITSYNDQAELGEKKNLSAGIAFGGNLLAFGLILMKGVSINGLGEEAWTWMDRLTNIGYYAGAGCVLLVLVRIITDRAFLPKAKLSKEIVADQNINAGLIEATLALAMGATLAVCL